MFQPLSEQKEATIYQYRLVRKLHLAPVLIKFHYGTGLVLAVALLIMTPVSGLLGLAAGLLLMPLLYFSLARLIWIRTASEFKSRRWSWRLHPPLLGYLPGLPVELSAFNRLHLHSLWIGLCFIAIPYPWLPLGILTGAALVHLWLLAPLLTAVFLLYQERRDGVIKLPTEEPYFLYYHR